DKFRQINRFLEFIEDILPQLDRGRELTIRYASYNSMETTDGSAAFGSMPDFLFGHYDGKLCQSGNSSIYFKKLR
ncbi:MAG: hypothetical protein KHZ48_13390, partial [Peptostreptococcaceae bacterium]|nr:hypothetical protein [Peptostreptococcaceae bacterium]